MSNLVEQWEGLNKRQNQINDQHKGSGAKAQAWGLEVNEKANKLQFS